MIWIMVAVPVAWAAFVKFYLKTTYTWLEALGHIAIVSALMVGAAQIGKYSVLEDTEILNGQLTGKSRDHGQYTEFYDCNCTWVTNSNGNSVQKCQTCSREHYTVDWILHSTLGNYTVRSLDSLSSSVYSTPNPGLYKRAQEGDACSRTHGYQNYFRAAPNSLQHLSGTVASSHFLKKGMLPPYPSVHSLYKVDRVLDPGNRVPADVENKLNEKISLALRTLGPAKQLNAIVVFAPTADPKYRYALEQHWLGGKKNDAIVLIGVEEYPAIEWAGVITLAANNGNEMLAVKMRDDLKALGDASDPVAMADTITSNLQKHFKRMPMAEWEHLEEEYTPPLWIIITMMVINIVANIGLTWVFHKNDIKPKRS